MEETEGSASTTAAAAAPALLVGHAGCWKSVDETCLEGSKGGHTAVVYKGTLFCFGGETPEYEFTACTPVITDKTLRLQWFPVPVKESPMPTGIGAGSSVATLPDSRTYHTAVVHEDSMVIYGGWDDVRKATSRDVLWRFSFPERRWAQIVQPPGDITLEQRMSHTAVVHSGVMYVFGGLGSQANILDNQVLALDLTRFTCSRVKTTGTPPCKRYGHAAVVFRASMYVFGGLKSKGARVPTDLFKLDLITREWSVVPATGTPPPRCEYHTAVVHESCLYVFTTLVPTSAGPAAGEDSPSRVSRRNVFKFDFEKREWSHEYLYGSQDSEHANRIRNAVAAIGHSILVTGGERSAVLTSEYRVVPKDDGWRKLLTTGMLSDITFTFPEPEARTLRAHKAILSSKSEYFRVLFTNGMKETTCPAVRMECSHDAFAALLDFVYTGDVSSCCRPEVAAEVLELCTSHLMSDLKGVLERMMCSEVSAENAVLLWNLSVRLDCQDLRKACLLFIAHNYDDVSRTPDFKQHFPEEVREVVSFLAQRW